MVGEYRLYFVKKQCDTSLWLLKQRDSVDSNGYTYTLQLYQRRPASKKMYIYYFYTNIFKTVILFNFEFHSEATLER